jgi:hypothetical protein
MIEVRCQTPGCDKVVPIPEGNGAEGLRCPRCRVPLSNLLPPAAAAAGTTSSDPAAPGESTARRPAADAAGSEAPPPARRRRLMLGGLLAGVSVGFVGWLLFSSFFPADDAAVPAEPISNPAPAGAVQADGRQARKACSVS